MGKKAVYNKQYLAIYITKEHFDKLLNEMGLLLPVYIGKNQQSIGTCHVTIDTMTRLSCRYALDAERKAVKEIQDQFAKDNPNYESSYKVQRRQQRGRKRLQQRTDDDGQV